MGKYSGYLICADLDGTLLNDDGNLIPENTHAIQNFTDQGGLFTVITGRAKNYLADKFGENLKTNTYGVALNGTVIYDNLNNEIKFEKFIVTSKLTGIDEFIFNNNNNLLKVRFHSGEKVYSSFTEVPQNKIINKIVFEFKDEYSCLCFKEKIEKVYYDFCHYCRSWGEGLEMLPKGGGKGESIKELRKLLKNEVHTVISVGNYENDISMIKEADIGYATENAIPVVKEAADRITVSNNIGAIADIISKIF